MFANNYPNQGLGRSPAYGDIPPDMYMRKISQTNYYEDPEQLDNHMRKLLKDFRPDKPFFESDQIRRPGDPGGGNHSSEFLNVRHSGARSTELPFLPDGTFLDWEFTERDPRGTTNMPDMMKHREQQFARASLVKKSPDADYSVPESGVNPAQMVAIKKQVFEGFRDRFQNFETSMDNFHNGGTGISQGIHAYGTPITEKVSLDGQILDLSDTTIRNRRDATAILSEDPTVAFRHSTTDHKFKISRYGNIRTSQYLSDNDWTNNRLSQYQDHIMVDLGIQLVNRKLADVIIDLEGIRGTKQTVTQGVDYNDSNLAGNRSKRMKPADVYKILMQGLTTQSLSAHSLLGGEMRNKITATDADFRSMLDQSLINHKITTSMEQATRTTSKEDRKDLREQIIQTASDQGLYQELGTRGGRKTESSNIGRLSLDNREIEESRSVTNYAGIIPAKDYYTYDKLSIEAFGEESLDGLVRKHSKNKSKNRSKSDHEYDIKQGEFEFGVYNKAKQLDADSVKGRRNQYGMQFDTIRDESFGEIDYEEM